MILQLMKRRNISPLPSFSMPKSRRTDQPRQKPSPVKNTPSQPSTNLPTRAANLQHQVPTAGHTAPTPFSSAAHTTPTPSLISSDPQEPHPHHQNYTPSQQPRLLTPTPPRYFHPNKRARADDEPPKANAKRRRGGMFSDLPYRGSSER